MKSAPHVFALVLLGTICFTPRLLADDRLGQDLGTIHFAVNGTPSVQAQVVRGVKLLHHMMYPEADRAFAAAAQADPACAFAYWGRAMAIVHPLWPDSPSDDERRQGAAYLRSGLAIESSTQRERAYLNAMNQYFGETAAGDHAARLKALDVAWGDLADKYPDDLDALAFSALFHLAPARFTAKDVSHRRQLEAAARLQRVAAQIPDHSGAQHYKIHAFDFPLLADRALEVCESYSSIAPEVPHALHMPSHIYTRRGWWEKSIEFNLRSADAAQKLRASTGEISSHLPHALDYLTYAYLQLGQYHQAETLRDKLHSLNGPYSPVQLSATAFAFAAIPARCALERQAWAEAAVLPLHQPATFPWGARYLNCDSIVHFARAIGSARSGKLDTARTEIVELEKVLSDLTVAKRENYWIAQAKTQSLTAQAWVLLATKNSEEAVALMKQATELEATADKEAVTPGEVLPAGDLLGEMLLEVGHPEEALPAFEAVLASSPNRLNTLYGAGLAAERAGNGDKASQYYTQMTTVAAASDPGVGRIEYARAYLKGHVSRSETLRETP